MKSMFPDHRIFDNCTVITAHFDASSNKHRIDVTFSETVARLLAGTTGDQHHLADTGNPSEDNAAFLCEDLEERAGESVVKMSGCSGGSFAADHAYPVTVE